jgi:hypothetical protein
MSNLSLSDEKSNKFSTSSLKLISKVKQSIESKSNSYNLEVTNEGMEYLNQLNTNKIGIISIIGPEKSEKSYFANLILGEKAAFDSSKSTTDIYTWGQPIVQGDSTELLVIDTEGLYKQINSKTQYDKHTFILSCLSSSIMIYNTNETIQDCVNKFTNLAKESLSCIKKINGKDLTSTDMPLVYFILHNNNIDSNTANQQFRNLVKDNPIFSIFFQNYKICVLKKAGDINVDLKRTKSFYSKKIAEIGSLDEVDYKQKAKLIKDQIMNDLEPKKINNCNIDGKCLFGLLQLFVDSLNKNENIILFEQFNKVLALCLSEIVDQINFNYTSEKLEEKMAKKIAFEETYLDTIKVTFTETIMEQFEKLKSTPIVKISPSTNVVNNIELILHKCINILCQNIQSNVDNKTKIINDMSKLEFNFKIKNSNIEQVFNEYNSFIYKKIFEPLFGKNDLKLQNNDKILKILEDKICGIISKISLIIQGNIVKLISENKKIKDEFDEFKKNHQKEIEKKEKDFKDRTINLEKRELDIKQKELFIKEDLKREQLKYSQLETRYNNFSRELKEKNKQIEELLNKNKELSNSKVFKNSNIYDVNNIQLKDLKNDYNNILDIFVNYKILVNKLINDKDFFFENILIDKNIGNLEKKYPKIFNLISERETLEEFIQAFTKEKERLNNEIKRIETINNDLKNQIKDLNEKLENSKQNSEDYLRKLDTKISEFNNFKANYEVEKNDMKEKELKFNLSIAECEKFEKERISLNKEINCLQEVIQGILSKDQKKFEKNLNDLRDSSKKNISDWVNIFRLKWG